VPKENKFLKKKLSTTKLKHKADKVFSIWIRKRDGGRCITCDGVGNQAGHFMSRRFSATRFNEQNVNGQCAQCNVFEHGRRYEYGLALDIKYGSGTAEKLSKLAQTHHSFTREELEEIIEKYANHN
jgi:NinG protein